MDGATRLSLGTYPDTSLSLAQKKADEARKLVSAGTDPSDVREETRSELAAKAPHASLQLFRVPAFVGRIADAHTAIRGLDLVSCCR
jgi:Arm DNA-binding domain